jgi:putative long chain acyl-CoA synthase
MAEARRGSAWKGLGRGLAQLGRGVDNALTLLREGRISAPYAAPFEVALETPVYKLRRYGSPPNDGPALVLVPPLMLASEVYDISPELSAVQFLLAQGVDVWIVDFGRPEAQEGGLERTLDDHVLAVSTALDRVAEVNGRTPHLAGYSQGGMFCYLAGAYRRSAGIASIITFGSPVDIHKNVPALKNTLAERLVQVARSALAGPLGDLEGLSGSFTSRGFKLMNPKQELKHLVEILGLLPDREALARKEPARKFLGGEGFVAWPGPAFRKFVDELVVDNRMQIGGAVIGGRSVSLADLRMPVLYFMGAKDDMALPASVRAIQGAAPAAQLHGVEVQAGHFGLVVGSKALGEVWPTVVAWLAHVEGQGPLPERLLAPPKPKQPAPGRGVVQGLYEVATEVLDGLWTQMGEAGGELGGVIDALRWQLPRLARLESLEDDTRVSLSRALADQARAIPDRTFFLWQGRAFSYAEADRRVNQVLHVLLERRLKKGQRVGVLMDNQPDYLTAVVAVNRVGAVAVLLNAGLRGRSLEQALAAGEVELLVVDPAHAEAGEATLPGRVAVLDDAVGAHPTAPPAGLEVDQGRAADLALLMFTSGTQGLPKGARISNRRWAVAALGSAAACKLTPGDTVYCCLPLHHATGMLVAVGGALIGGARLALAPRFSTSSFWEDVRRTGSTVVFYVGELCRYLCAAPPVPGEQKHPVRLFAGNGMRPAVWGRLLERFGPVRVLEFYGSTEGNLVLANLTGDKVGSVGRLLAGSGYAALVAYDPVEDRYVKGPGGWLQRVGVGEPGALLARIQDSHPLAHFDGYLRPEDTEAKILRNVFELGDAWFVTGDLLRVDADGDYWFVDRVGDTFRWKGENVSTEQVRAVLEEAPFVRLSAVYGVEVPGREGRAGMAAIELGAGTTFDGQALYALVSENLFPAARPRFVRIVPSLDTTASLKVWKHALQREGCDPGRIQDPIAYLDEEARAYLPLDTETFARLSP